MYGPPEEVRGMGACLPGPESCGWPRSKEFQLHRKKQTARRLSLIQQCEIEGLQRGARWRQCDSLG
ncbi:hypothetical protein E2C01_099887 [Portunus trituberculatus]|uniref:Uncharacterized protein n=1 Tax=Portunus trituberculatus TaxID=210409 RepID=A0A5B7K6N1_PORTR|nr:hypothetical protein [Portunus trituberculatus]